MNKHLFFIFAFTFISSAIYAQSFTESPFYWHYMGFRQYDYATSYWGIKTDEGIAKKILLNYSPNQHDFSNVFNVGLPNAGSFGFASGRGELNKTPVSLGRNLSLKSEFASDLSLYNSLYLNLNRSKKSILINANHNYNNNKIDKNNDHITDQPVTNNFNIGIEGAWRGKNREFKINFLSFRKNEFRGIDTSDNSSVYNLRSDLQLNGGGINYNWEFKNFHFYSNVSFYQYDEKSEYGINHYEVDEHVVRSYFLTRYSRKNFRLDFEGGYRNYFGEEKLGSDLFVNDRTNYHLYTGAQFVLRKNLELLTAFRADFNSAWGTILQPMGTLLINNINPFGMRFYYARSFHYNAPLLLASSLLISDRTFTFTSPIEPDLFDKFGTHFRYIRSHFEINLVYNFLLYQRRFRMDVISSPGEIIFTSEGKAGYDHFLELNTKIRPPGRYECTILSKLDISRAEFSGKMMQTPFIPVSTTGLKNKVFIGHHNYDRSSFLSVDFYYNTVITLPSPEVNSRDEMAGVFSAHFNGQLHLSSIEIVNDKKLSNIIFIQFGIENLINTAKIPGAINNTNLNSVDYINYYGVRRYYLGVKLNIR